MLKNYFTIAWRNLRNSKMYSAINIGGLAVGMTVALLISLWINSEISFNKSFDHYKNIAQLWQNVNFTGEKATYNVMPIPLAQELRTKFPDFKAVSLSSNQSFILSSGEKKLSQTGNYVESSFANIFSLKMEAGNKDGLKEINSIMISQSLAKSLFGTENPIGKIIRINNKSSLKVTGVYEDFPENSAFSDVSCLMPWDLYTSSEQWVHDSKDQWDNNSWQIYVQIQGSDFKKVSAQIKDIRMKRSEPPPYKPEFFLHPMSKWHLYSDFANGVNIGGLISFVWLFGIIGTFVLLLACINFMNLSTARSEKRAKEVGIRKAIGSMRRQLVVQFFSESILVAMLAFMISLLLAQLTLPFFNGIAGKQIRILWTEPLFWIIGIGFSFFTGLIAGSYPAIYLSSFNPVKVLKGTFRVGRFAAIPRKVLVVIQFSVSLTLIIGTTIVFRQIQYAKNRSVGYNRNGLIEVNMSTPQLYEHYEALRNDLLHSGGVDEFAESSGSITEQSGGVTNISWPGKTPDMHQLFMSNRVTREYGKTIGWHLNGGRDFSKEFTTDSTSMILNESAVRLMALKNPINTTLKWGGKDYQVIGVIKDMVKENPFEPVSPSFFVMNYKEVNTIDIKLSSSLGIAESLAKVEEIFRRYNPASPFAYSFVDDIYGKKFLNEERIGKLAAFFAILAIFISCLGLFGVASFVAEQRTKEIGVRKVLGASIINLWSLLSKEFVGLVIISILISMPLAYYFMHHWLLNYNYRTEISWWIFASAGVAILLITILTVSFQAIKAAISNPVRSLRSE
jgi:putative ABC transport system permease protein